MKQIYWWLFIFAVALGIGLRIAAFFWNDRLAGDVNLFALTAREYVRHQRLDYPLKYEFTEQVPYRVLHTPASQHPPLWPFLGGSVARWLATDDTFFVLKLLCAVTGSLLLIAIVMLVNRLQWPMEERLIGLALILLSPLLTDFSANGSPYIVLALLLVLASLLFLSAQRQSPIRYAFAGLVCGVALQIHSLMFFLPVLFLYFWLQDRRRGQVNWRGVLIFAMTGLLTVLPWLWWNQQHFGRLFYSSSTNHLFSQLGLLQFVADDKGLYYRVVMQPLAVLAPVYLRLFWKSLWEFSLYFLYEVGPFWLIPFWIGCRTHWRENRHQSTILLLPVAGAAVVVLLWANAKFRFLVPCSRLPICWRPKAASTSIAANPAPATSVTSAWLASSAGVPALISGNPLPGMPPLTTRTRNSPPRCSPSLNNWPTNHPVSSLAMQTLSMGESKRFTGINTPISKPPASRHNIYPASLPTFKSATSGPILR